MEANRLLLAIALVKVLPFQHARDVVVRAELNHLLSPHGIHPLAVERHGGLLAVQNLKDLPFVGLGVLLDLGLRERDTSL